MSPLIATARALMAPGKGLLAMDESVGTCNRRLTEATSGAILFDETLHQNTGDGVPFIDVLRAAGILVGIKVDAGAKALAGHAAEHVTEGLDGLRGRLAKWRAVLAIGHGLPSRACISVNAHALARCREVTAEVLHQVFDQLHRQGVALEAMVLKPNMVLPGLSCAGPAARCNSLRSSCGPATMRTAPPHSAPCCTAHAAMARRLRATTAVRWNRKY